MYRYNVSLDDPKVSPDLDQPLDMYKFILWKLITFELPASMHYYGCPEIADTLKQIKYTKLKYNGFLRKNQENPMTDLEKLHVGSAYSALEFSEIALEILAGTNFFNRVGVKKLYQVCEKMLAGHAGIFAFSFVKVLQAFTLRTECPELCRFFLCLMNQVHKNYTDLYVKYKTMPKLNNEKAFFACRQDMIVHAKMMILLRALGRAESIKILGPIEKYENFPFDSPYAETLMKLVKNSGHNDYFYTIPLTVETLDQAKAQYQLIMDLKIQRLSYLDDSDMYQQKYFDGFEDSYLATFSPDSPNVYKLCKDSSKALLEYYFMCINQRTPMTTE